MIVYSMICLGLKVNDFMQLQEREKKFSNSEMFKVEHDKFVKLYLEVNYATLVFSILCVLATFYVKYSVMQNKVFNSLLYRKFMIGLFVLVLAYIGLFAYFVFAFLGHSNLELQKILDGMLAIENMMVENRVRNMVEYLLSLVNILGIYSIVILSNEMVEEIDHLEKLRAKNNQENSLLVS